MKKLLILMLLGVLFVPMNGSAKADQVLYRQSEVATGFDEVNGTWREARFQKERYTVKVSGDFEKVTGIQNQTFHCRVPYERKPETIICEDISGLSFFYDKSSKRFIYSAVNVFTYVGADTPAMFAGTCQKF